MITILCSGSRGDFQPYIALAQELMKLGKEVRITAGKSYQDFIQQHGVATYPVNADFASLQVDPKLLEAAGSSDNPLKMLLTFRKMREYGVHLVEDFYAACGDSELVVYHPGCTIGYFAARQAGIPAVLASPFPLHRTRERLSVILYGRAPENALARGASYAMLQEMLWMASKDSVKQFWKTKFGALPESFGNPMERHNDPRHPAVVSCSNHVFPRPGDWSPQVHQAGYWFVEEPAGWSPDPRLAAFLDAGPPPVFIGFGSITALGKHQGLAELAVSALEKAGQRGIVSGLGVSPEAGGNVLFIDQAPHSWLFDRVSAVCHHGGAGTTAAGLKAGVPSIIIPFSNDQFAWAHRVHELGVAPRPVPKKAVTPALLAQSIREALEDRVVENARALGKKIGLENGARHCARVIAATAER